MHEHHGSTVSAVAGGRSIAYSAETAGRAGRVACQVLRSDGTDDGALIFSIVIRNDSDSDVRAVAFIPSERGSSGTLVQCSVQRTCDFSTTVELKRPAYRNVPDLHIDVHGADIGFVLIVPNATNGGPSPAPEAATSFALAPVEAARQPLPPAIPRPNSGRAAFEQRARASQSPRTLDSRTGPRSPAAMPVFLLFLALVAAAGSALFRPQIGELRMPHEARAASVVAIGYRATGLGAITYTVVGPDAANVAAGPLRVGSGTLLISLPKSGKEGAYLVRLSMKGPLGGDIAEGYVHVPALVVAPPPSPPRVRVVQAAPPEIRSLALDRATLIGGGSVNVYYDVDAASGTIALVDSAAQITYGRAPIDASGHAALAVPAVQTERQLSVVLTARRGSSISRSRVAVTAEPQSSPTPPADGVNAAQSIPGSNGDVRAPAIATPQTVRAGATFAVTIDGGVPGLNLVLDDVDGNELARALIEPSQRSVTFNAPNVRSPVTLRLLGVYPQGTGSETIVKTIRVTAR